ncbi:MAG: hypothetical protein H8E64_06715 [Candidatus Marinimicrobia bacterium]|nr:hypothetical protein [Candidatus Neomarinimicrobiota bacterium]
MKIFKDVVFTIMVLVLMIGCSRKPAGPVNAYRTSVGSGEDEIPLVVVSGTPYEMGHALGRLMKDEVNQCITGFLEWAQMADPGGFSDNILDQAWDRISPFTHQRIKDELQGLADGAGIEYDILRRAHMIPVVAANACSGVVVWGNASNNGSLYHLRNLDFVMDASLQDFPLVIVYIPDEGQPHFIPTFAGYIGANTGMNAKGIILGEKGESPYTEYPFEIDGNHFTFLFRDILYDTKTLEEARRYIENADLIKRYYYYLSDGKVESQGAYKFKVESPDSISLFLWSDNDSQDELYPNVFEDIIYHTMDNENAFTYLTNHYGHLDERAMIELSRQVAMKRENLMNVIYNGNTLDMWVTYAHGYKLASTREYVYIKIDNYLD